MDEAYRDQAEEPREGEHALEPAHLRPAAQEVEAPLREAELGEALPEPDETWTPRGPRPLDEPMGFRPNAISDAERAILERVANGELTPAQGMEELNRLKNTQEVGRPATTQAEKFEGLSDEVDAGNITSDERDLYMQDKSVRL